MVFVVQLVTEVAGLTEILRFTCNGVEMEIARVVIDDYARGNANRLRIGHAPCGSSRNTSTYGSQSVARAHGKILKRAPAW